MIETVGRRGPAIDENLQRVVMNPQPDGFRERVVRAAQAALGATGSVGPLELLQQMRLLQPSHVDSWRHGRLEVLETCIEGSPKKLARAFHLFHEWARELGLKRIEASYLRADRRGHQPLRVTLSGDPDQEAFYRTHYVPGDLSERRQAQVEAKLKKAPDLIVFETVAESVSCSECQAELLQGNMLFMENGQPLCLGCADLDRLEYLPRGDAAMSRRARKYSALAAVVVRFSRARRRYERQGLLVSADAIARAEKECLADAPERAAQRLKERERRSQEDAAFVEELSVAIARLYPRCSVAEVRAIAEHTARRGSGRVGRSAAARALNSEAITLAVIAHIRHSHTNYDLLLMRGTDRAEARRAIRDTVEQRLRDWAPG